MKRDKLLFLLRILKTGDVRGLVSLIKFRLYNKEICLGFSKRIDIENNAVSNSTICITEKMSSEKLYFIIDMAEKLYGEYGYFERRKRLIEHGIGRCYVSFIDSVPCHFNWVFDSKDNDKLISYFRGEYPRLNESEAILEHALTLALYRGKGIHKAARQKIMETERKENGIRRFISFINPLNKPSMKTAVGQGFVPFLIRREKWFLFRQRFVFEKFSEDRLRMLTKKKLIPLLQNPGSQSCIDPDKTSQHL